jgi:hypothetical protein
VSVLHPAVRVRAPDGRGWEIYAYKVKLPPREGPTRGLRRRVARAAAVCAHAVRSLRSDEWTIQAIVWLPQKQTYTWTTTREFRGQVLAQVEGHLLRGDVPHRLAHTVYLGFD